MIQCVFVLCLLCLLSTCSIFRKSSSKDRLGWSRVEYDLVDNSGKFKEIRETGFNRKNINEFVVKRMIKAHDGDGKILERSITISTLGTLKGKLPVLRPKASQYTVWFDGAEYSSTLKVNIEKRSIDVSLKSPEKQWNGNSTVLFPKGTGVFCYFSQLFECVKVTDFFSKAIQEEAGQMNFHVIIDGFPYFQEQYLNVPQKIFIPVKLEYDGINKNGERRFSLQIAGQSIFYFIDSNELLIKMFWTQQGLSAVRCGT